MADHLGEPDGPRATVTWTLGEAPLRYYLSTGAIQLKASEGYDWLVREIAFVSMGRRRRRRGDCSVPASAKPATKTSAALFIRRYRVAGPDLAPLRLRGLRHAQTDFRNNGVLLDGVGPG